MDRLIPEEAEERFGHIDAEFVSCDCLPGAKEATFKVKFYPFWEHPNYRLAIESGRRWSCPDMEQLAQVVSVRAFDVIEVRLSARAHVTDWEFPRFHDALERFEDSAEIFCNSEFSPKELLRRVRSRQLPHLGDPVAACGYGRDVTPPVSLGRFPASKFSVYREELLAMGTSLHIAREPEVREPPAMLLVDGVDYVVAEKLQIEVPSFDHDPEWVVLE